MNGIYNNISPVINTAPQAWIDQQTLRGIGSNRSRLYVDPMGDLWGQFENNPPKKIANLGGTGSSSSTGVPVGAVFQWIGAVAPVGYIMCDGNSVSGMYPKLIALLTSYGGKTPDLRGRFVIGASTTSPSYTSSFPGPLQLMANGGNFETTLDLQHLPEHSHEIEEEAAASHTHLFDVPDHTHSVTTETLTGHSHAVDSPDATVTHWTGSAWDSQGNDGSTGDNDTWEPSFDSSTWTNAVEDSDGGEFYINTDTQSDGTDWSDKPTFSADADTTTGGATFSGTPAASSAGAITNRSTADGGAIDYNTTDGGYHDHLTTQDDSAVADGDPDSYSGDGGIDLDTDTTDWTTKPDFSVDADTTTGAATYPNTPAAAGGGAITNRSTDNGGAIDFTTTDGGYHDHLTTQDDSAVADGDPDSYSADGGIDLDTDTTDWTTKPDFSVDADTTTGAASYPNTPAAVSGAAVTNRETDDGGAISYDTTDGGYHDHLSSQDDSAVADGDPDSYSGDGGIDVDITDTTWTNKPTVSSTISNGYTGAAQSEDSGSYDTWEPTIDATISSDDTTDNLYTSGTCAEGDGVHQHTLAVGLGGAHGHTATSSSSSSSTSTALSDATDNFGLTPNPHNHGAGTLDAMTWGNADIWGIEHYSDDPASSAVWNYAVLSDDATGSSNSDNLILDNISGSTGVRTLTITGDVDVATSVDTSTTTTTTTTVDSEAGHVHTGATTTAATADATVRGGHTHTFGDGETEGDITVVIDNHALTNADHVHSFGGSITSTLTDNWEHDHHFDIPFTRGTHAHDIDIEGHTHTFDIPAHGHALANLAHTHDIDGISVTPDASNWDHTHHFDIPFSRGTHSHDIDIEGHAHTFDIPSHVHALVNLSHTHDIDGIDVDADASNWDHTHHFDIPFSRGTHAHDIDIEGHTHTFDIPSHVHAVVNLEHTHDIDGLDVEADENNWEHSHKTNIDNLHHTHALTDTAHYHSFDIDLQASTDSTNNGVSWVGPMGASGTAATAGGVTDRETSEAQEAAHAHGGRTGNAGLSTPDPVQSLPPYIAMNFIIKHD